MHLKVGQRIDDRYVLLARLGKGGQGEVWKVEDSLKPGVPRAIKLMNVAQAQAAQIERVRREAKQLVELTHPSLVTCYALFEDVRREVMGLVMDYIEGESLDALEKDPRLTREHRLAVLGHIAGVLAYVHQRSVVHRDIKLENVIVGHGFWNDPRDPQHLKVIDFGIAAPSGNPKPLTEFGHVIGTPSYMAPEVLDPEYWRADTSRPAGDVFSWGVVAWRLLLGGHPTGFENKTVKDLARIYRNLRETRADWPQGLPREHWAHVLGEALALDPARRLPNGPALVKLIEREAPEMAAPAIKPIKKAPPPAIESSAATADDEKLTVVDAARAPWQERAGQLPLCLQPTVPASAQLGGSRGAPGERGDPGSDNVPTATPVSGPVRMPRRSPKRLPLPPPIRQWRPSQARVVALAGGALLLASLALVVLLVSRSGPEDSAPEAPDRSPTISRSSRTSRPPPTPSDTDCASGVPCEPRCSELLNGKARFELRFSSLQLEKGLRLAPNAVVCTSVARMLIKNEACTSIQDAQTTRLAGVVPGKRFAKEYLSVTHADLAERGLNVRVLSAPGGRVLTQASELRPNRGSIKQSALCQGYKVSGEFRGGVVVSHVTYFLHPEGSALPP